MEIYFVIYMLILISNKLYTKAEIDAYMTSAAPPQREGCVAAPPVPHSLE
jgi:hypothetical protein